MARFIACAAWEAPGAARKCGKQDLQHRVVGGGLWAPGSWLWAVGSGLLGSWAPWAPGLWSSGCGLLALESHRISTPHPDQNDPLHHAAVSAVSSSARLLPRWVGTMPGTWLDDGVPASVRRIRSAWLLCLLTGLVQKPLVRMAWDVEVTVEMMAALREVCGAPEVLGMTLILLRQVYAQKGQQMVGRMALELKGTWTVRALETLADALEDMHRRDNRKDKGRMRNYTGPAWIRLVAGDSSHYASLRAAGRVLGQPLVASAAAEVRGFHSTSTSSRARWPSCPKSPRMASLGCSARCALCWQTWASRPWPSPRRTGASASAT